jgi:Ankyrin repeats (3 copies)
MPIKLLPILSYLLIAGLLFFLLLMLNEPRSGSDAATRGIGKSMTLLALVAIVCLLVFNLQSNNLIKYLGLAIGLLCAAALFVFLLALSGSSLLYQDTRTPFTPVYEDPILTELFNAFHKGKVRRWKALCKAHPDHLQHKQLLKDVLYDANENKKSNPRKLRALKYMLEAGAKIDSSNCLDFAQFAYTYKTDFAELLLKQGVDPNCNPWPERKEPTLFYIIQGYNNDSRVIDLLVKYGADVDAKKYDEERQDYITPLLYAIHMGQWHCCMALLKNGADLNFKNKDGLSIKAYLLQLAENPEDLGYYKQADFLELVAQVKR